MLKCFGHLVLSTLTNLVTPPDSIVLYYSTLILLCLCFQGLVHKVTERCGDACVCIAKKRKKKMEEEELCCLSACQVKVLNISGYGGSRRELKQMRHFLGNLKSLVTVKVGVKAKKTTMLTITTRESPVLLLSFP